MISIIKLLIISSALLVIGYVAAVGLLFLTVMGLIVGLSWV